MRNSVASELHLDAELVTLFSVMAYETNLFLLGK